MKLLLLGLFAAVSGAHELLVHHGRITMPGATFTGDIVLAGVQMLVSDDTAARPSVLIPRGDIAEIRLENSALRIVRKRFQPEVTIVLDQPARAELIAAWVGMRPQK